jgi:hypothetical protein
MTDTLKAARIIAEAILAHGEAQHAAVCDPLESFRVARERIAAILAEGEPVTPSSVDFILQDVIEALDENDDYILIARIKDALEKRGGA